MADTLRFAFDAEQAAVLSSMAQNGNPWLLLLWLR